MLCYVMFTKVSSIWFGNYLAVDSIWHSISNPLHPLTPHTQTNNHQQFFGGLINRDPENSVSYLLEGTDFAGALYWANNFNDLLSGINVIFNLLVINNWNEMESGILAVSQTKQSRWFFFTFYIFGVILVNNLVIALSIDTFNNELEDDSKNGKNKKFSFLGKRLVFDANKLSKGNFNLSGNYEANLYTEHMTVREEKEILVDLFDDRGYTV